MDRDELTNAVTHLFGAVLAVAAASVLIVFASLKGSAWHVVSFSIFGAALILLYSASSAHHFAISPKVRVVFKRLDHAAVFVLIAGTYTPIALVALRGGWGWSLFGIAWGVALLGIIWKLTGVRAGSRFSTLLYLALGWMVVVAIIPLVRALSLDILFWLVAGGVFYTIGVAFLSLKRVPMFHTVFTPHNIFHFFVMFGSASHFWMVFLLLS